jgi:hypothetical protein
VAHVKNLLNAMHKPSAPLNPPIQTPQDYMYPPSTFELSTSRHPVYEQLHVQNSLDSAGAKGTFSPQPIIALADMVSYSGYVQNYECHYFTPE